MAITATITEQWQGGQRIHAVGTLAFTGSYTASGVAVDFGAAGVRSGAVPTHVDVNVDGLYSFKYVAGTTIADGKLWVYLTSTGAELSAAAFPAALLAASSKWHGIFKFGS